MSLRKLTQQTESKKELLKPMCAAKVCMDSQGHQSGQLDLTGGRSRRVRNKLIPSFRNRGGSIDESADSPELFIRQEDRMSGDPSVR